MDGRTVMGEKNSKKKIQTLHRRVSKDQKREALHWERGDLGTGRHLHEKTIHEVLEHPVSASQVPLCRRGNDPTLKSQLCPVTSDEKRREYTETSRNQQVISAVQH